MSYPILRQILPQLPTGSQPVRQTLVRTILWPSWIVTTALTLLFGTSSLSVPAWVQYLPFVLSLLLFGLPHGATDHLVWPRVRNRAIQPLFLLFFVTGYLALVGVYLVFWLVAPALAFIFFIIMTWFHWGQGDLYTLLHLFRATYLNNRLHRTLALVSRGGLPMLVPLLAFPDLYHDGARDIIRLFGPHQVDQISWAFQPSFRLALGVGFGLVLLLNLGLGFRETRRPHERTAWYTDFLECLLLIIYFSTVPPVLAIGIYFCVWHSLRHIARLMMLDAAAVADLETRDCQRALLRFFRDAAPLTVGALLILAGLYFLVPHSLASLPDFVALYLAFIAALTLPHIVVVCWLDRQQGVW